MTHKLPYRFLTHLFSIVCKPELFEELQGDLEEAYFINVGEKGAAEAKRIYLRELLSLARPSVVKKLRIVNNKPLVTMISNYTKITFRTLSKEKLFSSINVIGLAIGITACLVLWQYVNYESDFDNFHTEKENIFRVALDLNNPISGAIEFQNAQMYYALQHTVTQEVPEVKFSTQLFPVIGVFEYNKELHREEKVFMTSSSFFDVFSYPILKGSKAELDKINTLFLSERMAKKYFGEADPIGQRIIINSGLRNPLDVEVRGVFQDFPSNSHLKVNALISMAGFETMIDENQFFGPQLRLQDVRWRWMQFYTYIKMHSETNAQDLEAKLRAFCHKHRKPYDDQQGRISNVVLQPVSSIHLNSNRSGELETPGSHKLMQFLFGTGLLIIIIAWINYVNLSTAKAVNRAKEVGIRKVVGAFRNQIRTQFLFESLITNLLALTIAAIIIFFSQSYFQQLTGIPLFSWNESLLPDLGVFAIIILSGAFLSGLYPAWVLSSYKPIAVLKGKFSKSKGGIILRKGLVVFQFVIAIFLLTGIYAINTQLEFMTSSDMGLTIDSTLVIQRPPLPINEPASQQKVEAFRDQLLELSSVSEVTVASYMPGPENFFKQTSFISGNSDQSVLLSRVGVSPNFIDFFNIGMKEGRFFTGEQRGGSQQVVVNEKLVQSFGFKSNEDILGKFVEFPGGQSSEIIGVMGDFHSRGLRFPVDPLVMHLDSTSNGQFIAVKTKTEDLASIRDLYQASFPNTIFEVTRLEETFKTIYAEDRRFKNIVTIFTGIALVIACLGLLGLSSYLLTQRVKEISVRKVLGAKTSQLFGLLVKEYVWLSVVSTLISIPLTYQAIDQWLNSYATRMQLSPQLFLLPAIGLLAVVLVTIGYQILKAAWINPTENLKGE